MPFTNYQKAYPDYSANNFSHLPLLVRAFFGLYSMSDVPLTFDASLLSGRKNLIFLFVDGFGYRFLQRFREHPFLKKIDKYGKVVKTTSQFPSSTATHWTTINSGLPVGVHGIVDAFYYEPLADAIIDALKFKEVFDNRAVRDLSKDGLSINQILPQNTVTQEISKLGVKSYFIGNSDYTPSLYTNNIFKGTEKVIPYSTISEAFNIMFKILESNSPPIYVHFYTERIDSFSHKYGPTSSKTEEEISKFLDLLDTQFWPWFAKIIDKTALVIFPDHGQVRTHPDNLYFLNKICPKLTMFLRKSKKGYPLIPAGSIRSMFMYVKEKYLDDAYDLLHKCTKGIAEVYKTKELIDKGLFGPTITKRFLKRVGNLVVLPYPGNMVWWYHKNPPKLSFYGAHGGLTPEEVETWVGLM